VKVVHPEHHLSPVLRVGPAGAGLERDDGVARVVLAVEERRLLEPRDLASERLERRGDLVGHVAVHRSELARVVEVTAELSVAVEPLRRACVLGGDLRRPGLVVPEPRRVHLLFQIG
jgi:hypothetical protein